MGEETSNTMNLDLNLGPGPELASGSMSNDPINLDQWIDEPLHGYRESFVSRAHQRWRWREIPISPQTENIPVELNQIMVNSSDEISLRPGEGSVTVEERRDEEIKICEINSGVLEDETSENNDDVEKDSGNDGSFYDCNICLDLARDPVVTCCGHLFCWSCLYRWLHLHSDAKECPVCKGEVTIKTVTPIYGRGNDTREPEEDLSLKIPRRPHARQVESLRQTIQRSALTFPMEEMIRRLGNRSNLTRDLVQAHENENSRDSSERTQTFLNRVLTSRGLRREQTPVPSTDDVARLAEGDLSGLEAEENRSFRSQLLQRQSMHRTPDLDRLVDVYLGNRTIGRNQEQHAPVDDRDSFSSIAAVINSESQIDAAVEIDSTVSLSTSSSRRRNDASRASDVDGGESRAPRRRRLN